MDASYLVTAVAKPLAQCLQEVVMVRPKDPIEWIGLWLYKYMDNQIYYREKSVFLRTLQATEDELQRLKREDVIRRECLRTKLSELRSHLGEVAKSSRRSTAIDWATMELDMIKLKPPEKVIKTPVFDIDDGGTVVDAKSQRPSQAGSRPRSSVFEEAESLEGRRKSGSRRFSERKSRRSVSSETSTSDSDSDSSSDSVTPPAQAEDVMAQRRKSSALSRRKSSLKSRGHEDEAIEERPKEMEIPKKVKKEKKERPPKEKRRDSERVSKEWPKSVHLDDSMSVKSLGRPDEDGDDLLYPRDEDDDEVDNDRERGGKDRKKKIKKPRKEATKEAPVQPEHPAPKEKKRRKESRAREGSLRGSKTYPDTDFVITVEDKPRTSITKSTKEEEREEPQEKVEPPPPVYPAEWRLSCQWGLICEHPLLGDMEPRPPLIYPETPEWWERQDYKRESLYDPEIFTRENDDVIQDWDQMEHMTTNDFMTEGPWLSEGALRNVQPSHHDRYSMDFYQKRLSDPEKKKKKKKKKKKHEDEEGDDE